MLGCGGEEFFGLMAGEGPGVGRSGPRSRPERGDVVLDMRTGYSNVEEGSWTGRNWEEGGCC